MVEHMPECGALLCERCNAIEAWQGHYSTLGGHEFIPGPCNCEFGRLHAEVERLEAELKIYDKKAQTAIDKIMSSNSLEDENESLRAEVERLKGVSFTWEQRTINLKRWQRRALRELEGWVHAHCDHCPEASPSDEALVESLALIDQAQEADDEQPSST